MRQGTKTPVIMVYLSPPQGIFATATGSSNDYILVILVRRKPGHAS
jgi:hypothetical protein